MTASKRAGLEIAGGLALFFAATWLWGPAIASPAAALSYLAFLGCAACYVMHASRPALRAWLQIPLGNGAGYYALATAAGLAGLRLVGDSPSEGWLSLARDAVRYLPLAAAQGVALFAFFWPRVRVASGRMPQAAPFLFALLFAACHLPNAALMAATGLAGLVWAILYKHHPNPVLLVLSHAVLAAAYAHLLGLPTRVGPGYLDPGHHAFKKSLALLGLIAQ